MRAYHIHKALRNLIILLGHKFFFDLTQHHVKMFVEGLEIVGLNFGGYMEIARELTIASASDEDFFV